MTRGLFDQERQNEPHHAIQTQTSTSDYPLLKRGGGDGLIPVSYTHLDVYKRQVVGWACGWDKAITTSPFEEGII